MEILTIHFVESSAGRFVAYCDEFPEVVSQGSTESDATERLVYGLKNLGKIQTELSK